MRVLLGWEIGANQGHLTCLRQLASDLTLNGHEVLVAVKAVPGPIPDVAGCATIFAPSWQKRFSTTQPQPRCATMGDILAMSGLLDGDNLGRVLAAWQRIFGEFQPDLVIGEYAPALLCAAMGRIRSISIGTGFTSPPAGLASFPILDSEGWHQAETVLMDNVNRNLKLVEAQVLDALPAIFQADTILLATWPKLDPYHALRKSEHYVQPSISSTMPEAPVAGGDEVFVYTYAAVTADNLFWKALVAPGYPVRVHLKDATPDHITTFRRLGISFEVDPLGFDRIAERSRLVVSHGGHGTICSALLSGLPIITAALDLEKRLNGTAVANLGLGSCIPFEGRAIRVAENIVKIYSDDDVMRASAQFANQARQIRTTNITQLVKK